jgi:hypothetical protein
MRRGQAVAALAVATTLLWVESVAHAHTWAHMPVSDFEPGQGPTTIANPAYPSSCTWPFFYPTAITISPTIFGNPDEFLDIDVFILDNSKNSAGNYPLWVFETASGSGQWANENESFYGLWSAPYVSSYEQRASEFAWTQPSVGGLWEDYGTPTGNWVTIDNTSYEDRLLGYTSLATWNPTGEYGLVLGTNNTENCMPGELPNGPCVYYWVENASGLYSGLGAATVDGVQYGAEQVTVDTTTEAFYFLDQYGVVWNDSFESLNDLVCDNDYNSDDEKGGTLVARQIAAKDGYVYAISFAPECNGPGSVYWVNTNSSTTCWQNVGAWGTVFAVSIATDNNPGVESGIDFGYSVWATDDDNNVWFACSGSSCSTP